MQKQVETNDASHNVSNTVLKTATRRDVLRVATGAAGAIGVVGAVGAAAVMVPRFDQAQHDTSGLVTNHLVDVDLAPLQSGQQVMVYWRAWPIFVIRRSAQALATLQDQRRRRPPMGSFWPKSLGSIRNNPPPKADRVDRMPFRRIGVSMRPGTVLLTPSQTQSFENSSESLVGFELEK